MGTSGVMAQAWAEAIRGHMAQQRVSGFVLAERIGKSQNYLAKRLRNEAPLTINDIEAIVTALDLDLPALILESAAITGRLMGMRSTSGGNLYSDGQRIRG